MTSVIGSKDKITNSLTSKTVEFGRALSNRAGVPVTFGGLWAMPSVLSKCEWMPR